MKAVYILLAIVAAIVILGIAWVLNRADALDDREDELDKYSVHLDERANMLAKWEDDLRHGRPLNI